MELPPIFSAEVAALSERYGAPLLVEAQLNSSDFAPFTKDDRVGEVCMVIRRTSGKLLVFRKTFYPQGVLRLLTGGIEHNEAIYAALLREIAEETSLDVAVRRFLAVIRYRVPNALHPFCTFAFLADEVGGTLALADPDEQVEVYAECSVQELHTLADVLENLPDQDAPDIAGNWRNWGIYRAVTHRVVADRLRAEAIIEHNNLEEFQDPANYDLEEIPGSEVRNAFYLELAQQIGGPILELACGTGIVSIPLIEQGLEVTGLDLALPMLEYARYKTEQRGLTAQWIHADARSFDLGRTFRFIFLTGNAFQAFLSRADQDQLLGAVRRHLAPDGLFVFDTRNPSGHDLSDSTGEVFWKSYENTLGQMVSIHETQRYDAENQVLEWTLYRRWEAGGTPQLKVSRIACKFTEQAELMEMLHSNGFVIEAQYGGWDRSPVTPQSYSIISLCRVAA